MVPAAAISPAAQAAIERHLEEGCCGVDQIINDFLRRLESGKLDAIEAQKRFTILRLRFNDILSEFDIFADVLDQRSEHETGVWISGLDAVAFDALRVPGVSMNTPPVVCYLDRGHGAAIRRARTRLPGGRENPVAVVRVPRERMIGNGIASSLMHEVGHQGSVLLNLINSIRPVLKGMQGNGEERSVWTYWERWISEIIADFWAVARVGIVSTLGLIGVVSLPRVFVFRFSLEDPHPFPWIRVKISCALGNALYPHPQWAAVSKLWESFYPLTGINNKQLRLISELQASIPRFLEMFLGHRPGSLKGRSLAETFRLPDRQNNRLKALFEEWRASPRKMQTAPPSQVFAVIGQARADGRITTQKESELLSKVLGHWALKSTLDPSGAYLNQLFGQYQQGNLISV